MSEHVEPSQDYLVKICREIAESEKFVAEQRKMMAESAKLNSERRKFDREPITTIIGATAALIAASAAAGRFGGQMAWTLKHKILLPRRQRRIPIRIGGSDMTKKLTIIVDAEIYMTACAA